MDAIETLKHVLFLARHLPKDNVQTAVALILLELEIPSEYDGFRYLKSAIPMYYENPSLFLTKELYPAVGKIHGSSGLMVERSIRFAISSAWKRSDKKAWNLYFPMNQNRKIQKPSNGEFIAQIARFLELWQNCYEEDDSNARTSETVAG